MDRPEDLEDDARGRAACGVILCARRHSPTGHHYAEAAMRPALAAFVAPPPALALIVQAVNALVDRVNVIQGELTELRRDLTLLTAALHAAQGGEHVDAADRP